MSKTTFRVLSNVSNVMHVCPQSQTSHTFEMIRAETRIYMVIAGFIYREITFRCSRMRFWHFEMLRVFMQIQSFRGNGTCKQNVKNFVLTNRLLNKLKIAEKLNRIPLFRDDELIFLNCIKVKQTVECTRKKRDSLATCVRRKGKRKNSKTRW